MTIVPLKLYFNESGRAKVEIALARGKVTSSSKPIISKKLKKMAKAAKKPRKANATRKKH